MQLLEELQGLLQQTYDLPGEHRVTDFLTMNPAVIEALGIALESAGAREQLLVSQQDDSVDLAVYIAPEVLARLGDSDPLEFLHDGNLADFWLVLEGVSHFVYLAWNAGMDKPVTRLELELQAEVDKFVLGALLLAARQGSAPDALHPRALPPPSRPRVAHARTAAFLPDEPGRQAGLHRPRRSGRRGAIAEADPDFADLLDFAADPGELGRPLGRLGRGT